MIMRRILDRKRVVQTIATVRDDLYDRATLEKMYFGSTLVTYSVWAQHKLAQMGFSEVDQIYPGIDLAKFSPTQKDVTLMKKWGYTENDIIVTYPGEFTRLGATDLIIDAFTEIWRDPANAHIKYLCNCRIKNEADEKKKQAVITQLEKMRYRDRVIFTDTFADMNAIYNLSDMIIFPVTTMRGKFDVPLAMIEPYACKKPVIASDLDLFKEFSHPDINVIIPPANSSALSQAIVALANDRQKQQTLGENAYIFAHKTFNISHIAHNYDTLYKRIQG
jgi:glycosyltransferase involved in cell wall biosynthesis